MVEFGNELSRSNGVGGSGGEASWYQSEGNGFNINTILPVLPSSGYPTEFSVTHELVQGLFSDIYVSAAVPGIELINGSWRVHAELEFERITETRARVADVG